MEAVVPASSPPQLSVQLPQSSVSQEYVAQAWLLHFWDDSGLVPEQKASATIFPVESMHCTTRVWVPPAGAGKAVQFGTSEKRSWETGSMASHCAPQLTSTALGAGAPVLRLPQVCEAGLAVAHLGRQRLGTRAEGISDDVSSRIHALHYACLGATCRSRQGSIVWNQRKAQLETGSMASHCAPQLTSTALGAGAPVLRLPQVCDAGLDVALLGRQRLGTRAEGISDDVSSGIHALHYACLGATCRSRQGSTVWNQRKAQLETGSMASHCAPQLTLLVWA